MLKHNPCSKGGPPKFMDKCFIDRRDEVFRSMEKLTDVFEECFDDEGISSYFPICDLFNSIFFQADDLQDKIDDTDDWKEKEKYTKILDRMYEWSDEHSEKMQRCVGESGLDFDKGVNMMQVQDAEKRCREDTKCK